MSRPILSTHVLDISTGMPAVGLFVELYKSKDSSWILWHNTVTTSDGRVQFPFSKDSMAPGTYKLKFNVADYYKSVDKETLYPYVEIQTRELFVKTKVARYLTTFLEQITFNTTEGAHYHIPLLLSPYGYTTYRGS